MIGMLRGRLAARTSDGILIDCSGVGYRVSVPPGAHLPPVGEDAVLHVHTHVREDTLALYGFPTARELEIFQLLIACQGIGPRVAMACLSVLSPDALAKAVVDQDVATLTRVPGVGKRSAEKLLFELGPRLGAATDVTRGPPVHAEIRGALSGLGYADREVAAALSGLPESGDTAELLRMALKVLGGGE